MNRFPETLIALREAANLTSHELARRADVPDSLISGLQTGKRRVGEINARRIGVALGLSGDELEQFVLQAINTSTRKVLKSAQDFPAALLNFVAHQLEQAGVHPHLVSDCGYGAAGKDQLTLLLADGRIARINADLVIV